MSLNRSEQRLYDYIEAHPEERHFWEDKVRRFAAAQAGGAEAAVRIEGELWRYHVERAGVVPLLRQVAEREGLRRVSLRNLAELMMRRWAPPAAPKRAAAGGVGGPKG